MMIITRNDVATLRDIDKHFLRKWCIVELKNGSKKRVFILDTDYEFTDDLLVIYNYDGSIVHGDDDFKLQDIHSIILDQQN